MVYPGGCKDVPPHPSHPSPSLNQNQQGYSILAVDEHSIDTGKDLKND